MKAFKKGYKGVLLALAALVLASPVMASDDEHEISLSAFGSCAQLAQVVAEDSAKLGAKHACYRLGSEGAEVIEIKKIAQTALSCWADSDGDESGTVKIRLKFRCK